MSKKGKNKKNNRYPIIIRKYKKGESYRIKLPAELGSKFIKLGSSWEGFTYNDAVKAYKSIMGDIAKRKYSIGGTKIGTGFKKFTQAYLEDLKTKKDNISRERIYVSHYWESFGKTPLTAISSSDIKAYLDKRLKKVSPGTVRKEFYFLRKIFKLAARTEWWSISNLDDTFKNPCDGVTPPKENVARYRIASDKEIIKLLEHSPSEVIKNIILFAIYSGCRQGEILQLKEEQVNWEQGYIHWPQTKNMKPKDLPLSPTIEEILRDVPRVEESPYFFCSPRNGEPYTKDGFVTIFNRIRERAGLRNLHFHDLRRVFGTKLAEQGYKEKDIAELLGHSDTRSTKVYIEIAEERKKEAIKTVRITGL